MHRLGQVKIDGMENNEAINATAADEEERFSSSPSLFPSSTPRTTIRACHRP